MTSYLLPPPPPEDIAADVFLYAVGGVEDFCGEVALAPQRRPECLLVFSALSGQAVVRYAGDSFAVPEGALLAIPVGGGPLCASCEGPFSCAWALLGGTLPLRWVGSWEATRPNQAHSPAEGMLRALWRTAELGGLGDGWWGSAQAYGLLMKLRAQAAQATAAAPPLVEEAAALIRSDFAYLGGVEDLADRLGVSKSHLIRCFSSHFGISPGKYLTKTRMEYAKLLLQSSRYSLETVAAMVGVSGANYFCKLFKAHTGLTPAAFAASIPLGSASAGAAPDPRFYL